MNLKGAIRFENLFTTGNITTLAAIVATGAIWYAQMNSVAAQVPRNIVAIADLDKRVTVLEAQRVDDIENKKEIIRRLRDLQQSVDAINNRQHSP